MISELMKFWKLIYSAYQGGDIKKPMYYYLLGVLVVVAGLYFYLLWQGILGLSILFSSLTGTVSGIPITSAQAIGIIIIIRYSLLGGIDSVAKRTPDNITERLSVIEDKLSSLHRLAFGESEDPPNLPKSSNPKQPKSEIKIVNKSKNK